MNAKRFAIRMKKELEVFTSNPPHGISCCPKEDNKVVLEAVIIGPEGSAYEGGIFHLDLNIPDEYPFYPPRVRFLTKVYHPNIDEHGRICLDILKVPPNGCWRCTCSIANVLIGVQCLLSEPNAEDPLSPDIANLYSNNRELFIKTAKEYTQRYAKFEKPPVLPDTVITSPLLRSKFISKPLANIPAVCDLEENSSSLVSIIREMDKEYERESSDEPGPSTSTSSVSSSKRAMPSLYQLPSSSPKLSIMEPDHSESDDEKDITGSGPRTSSKLCLPSTSKQALEYYPQVSPRLSIMEPDLMESDTEEEKTMYCEPGPSSKLFLPSKSLPKISSMSIISEEQSFKDIEHSELKRKRDSPPDLPLSLTESSEDDSKDNELKRGKDYYLQSLKKLKYIENIPYKKLMEKHEIDPNMPSTSGLNLKRLKKHKYYENRPYKKLIEKHEIDPDMPSTSGLNLKKLKSLKRVEHIPYKKLMKKHEDGPNMPSTSGLSLKRPASLPDSSEDDNSDNEPRRRKDYLQHLKNLKYVENIPFKKSVKKHEVDALLPSTSGLSLKTPSSLTDSSEDDSSDNEPRRKKNNYSQYLKNLKYVENIQYKKLMKKHEIDTIMSWTPGLSLKRGSDGILETDTEPLRKYRKNP